MVLATERGRAFMLHVAADAEDSEGGLFDALADAVAPELVAKVLKHQSDESRHALMLRARVVANGGVFGGITPPMQLFRRLVDAVGGLDPSDPLFVFRSYCLLWVAEERAQSQYSFLEPLLREFDPLSADVLAEIVSDERIHLGYCEMIARRYAPREIELADTLAAFRDIEARVFYEFSAAVMGFET
jgi:hypothetical protein